MRSRRLLSAAVCLLWAATACSAMSPAPPRAAPRPAPAAVRFEPWARASFERAAREHRYLLVSVQTRWCHWCHVMNDVTFRDPEVARLLAQHFVVVKVDADARPDVAERYARWGWPASGLLTPDAEPLVNVRGYREPRGFARLLAAVAAHGAKATAVLAGQDGDQQSATPADLQALHGLALSMLDASWDDGQAGWGSPQKYPRGAPVEHAWLRAAIAREPERKAQALRALDAYARLIDPVWGGMFQYSVMGDWQHPHFEKIHSVQAGALETFANAYALTHDPVQLERASAIARYLREHLQRADGAFYANQDADVGRPGDADYQRGAEFYALGPEARARVRAPDIDQHVFANLNGQSIAAFAQLYAVTADDASLQTAVTAHRALERTHRRGAGYAHDPTGDDPRLYLTDQLELARALLSLHEVTGSAEYLQRARELCTFILTTFEDPQAGGFYAHTPDPEATGALARPRKPIAQNARLARVLLWLARLDGDASLREHAERALRAVADRAALAAEPQSLGEYTLALEDLQSPYVVLTIVGEADDPRSQILLRAALSAYAPNRRVHLTPPRESHYPYPGKPVAYLCSEDSCSLPVADPAALPAALLAALGNIGR